MHFVSDNWAGAHPAIAENVLRRNAGTMPAYGASDLDRRVEQIFCDLFETEVAVFFVGTGTAANALAMAAVNRPGGVVFCHSEAHLRVDECSAPEFFTQGVKLEAVQGALGKIEADDLDGAIRHVLDGGLNAGQPQAVSISQLTEAGTLYGLDEIGAIAEVAHGHGLPLHMDGARFANAVAALGCTPAEMTWKAGIDMVSFGATKNGCWCAEALIFFDPDKARAMPHLRKRAGHLFSKSRFIAAQFEAYLANGLWLDLAAHANAMGATIAKAVEQSTAFRLAWHPDGNEVFAIGGAAAVNELEANGVHCARWQPPRAERHLVEPDETMIRLVASFATETGDIEALRRALGNIAGT